MASPTFAEAGQHRDRSTRDNPAPALTMTRGNISGKAVVMAKLTVVANGTTTP